MTVIWDVFPSILTTLYFTATRTHMRTTLTQLAKSLSTPTAIAIFFVFLAQSTAFAQWNADAGLIPSFTKSGATVSASSTLDTLHPISLIVDTNESTSWASAKALPENYFVPNNYVTRANSNILLSLADSSRISSSNTVVQGNTKAYYKPITNGFMDSVAVNVAPLIFKNTSYDGRAMISFNLANKKKIRLISMRAYSDSSMAVYVFKNDTDSLKVGNASRQNYNVQRLIITDTAYQNVKKIRIYSKSGMNLYEVAATNLQEWVTVDFGTPKSLSAIISKYWSGYTATDKYVQKTEILAGNHVDSLYLIDTLPLSGITTFGKVLPSPITVRYLRFVHTLVTGSIADYRTVSFYEVDAYDQYGIYGAPPTPQVNNVKMRDFVGVNTVLGWERKTYISYTKCWVDSLRLPDNSGYIRKGLDQGPRRFKRLGDWARNYHFLAWDVKGSDPDSAILFPIRYDKMADTITTPAVMAPTEQYCGTLSTGLLKENWLNWDHDYRYWRREGLKLHGAINFDDLQIDNVGNESIWNNHQLAADSIGSQYARHFGPKPIGNGMIDVMEVGNEPWRTSAGNYAKILRGMVAGAKRANPSTKVIPCALQAAIKRNDNSTFWLKNYIGTRIPQTLADSLDGLNTHLYSYLTQPNGSEVGTYPEHPESSFREILNFVRWRNTNMPTKPVYVTEYGWDSGPKGNTVNGCNFSECVDTTSHAYYNVRGTLMLARYGVARAIAYFHANNNSAYRNTPTDTLIFSNQKFTRSGLEYRYYSHDKNNTDNQNYTNQWLASYIPKRAFYAMEEMKTILGDVSFLSMAKEDDNAYVYYFGDAKTGTVTHVAAWRPIDGTNTTTTTTTVTLPANTPPVKGWSIKGSFVPATKKMNIDTDSLTTLPTYNAATKQLTLSIGAAPIIVKLDNTVAVSVKVYLQGPYVAATGVMNDVLRKLATFPRTEPYTGMTGFTHVGSGGGESITDEAVLGNLGNAAVVDWVFLQLRDTPTNVKATRSALLLKNGTVVDTDGKSPVKFLGVTPGAYYVTVRHRNHLGVMTGVPTMLGGSAY
jgi:hypothetical protein